MIPCTLPRRSWAIPLVLAACAPKPEPTPPAGDQAPITDRIAVPETVRKNLGIEFVQVERRRIAQTLRFPGAFELLPTARHELRTPVAGRVTVLVEPLQEVQAGHVVFRVDAPEWRDRQREIGEIGTQMRVHEARLASLQPLIEAHRAHEASLRDGVLQFEARERHLLATQAEVGGHAAELAEARSQLARLRADAAEAAEKEAELGATLAEARAQVAAGAERFTLAIEAAAAVAGLPPAALLEQVPGGASPAPRWRVLAAIEVRADAPGVVDRLPVASGGWLAPGDLVASVSDLRQVRFRARALQSDLPRLQAGLPARAILAQSAATNAPPVPGTLLLGAVADPAQRTLDVFLSPKELAAWARPGVAGFLEIETASSEPAVLAIPLAAALQDGLERVLFRRDPKNGDQVIRLEADLGIDDGRWVEVKSGVMDGDQVVLAGAYELVLASSGAAPKGGHFHADGTFHADDHK